MSARSRVLEDLQRSIGFSFVEKDLSPSLRTEIGRQESRLDEIDSLTKSLNEKVSEEESYGKGDALFLFAMTILIAGLVMIAVASYFSLGWNWIGTGALLVGIGFSSFLWGWLGVGLLMLAGIFWIAELHSYITGAIFIAAAALFAYAAVSRPTETSALSERLEYVDQEYKDKNSKLAKNILAGLNDVYDERIHPSKTVYNINTNVPLDGSGILMQCRYCESDLQLQQNREQIRDTGGTRCQACGKWNIVPRHTIDRL